jgi:hypothetical protein
MVNASEVAAGRLGFDAARAAACLAEHVSCRDSTFTFRSPACRRLFHGLVKPGGECYTPVDIDNECAEGACLGTCPGHCKTPTPREDGAPCADGTCKPGSECRQLAPGTGFVCVHIVDDGACGGLTQCREGLFCSAGTCAQHIALGAGCNHDWECAPGLSCGGPDGARTCRTEVEPGAKCGDDLTACREGSLCGVGAGNPVCQLRVGPGHSCAVSPCGAGLECTEAEVCIVPLTLGEPCTVGCRWPLQCIDAICSMGAPAGASCKSSVQCDPSLFCDAGGTCRARGASWDKCDPKIVESCASTFANCTQIDAGSGAKYVCEPPCDGPDSAHYPGTTAR